MRVLHVPYTWAPDPVGGTEVFVEALAGALRPLGWESSIAAPAAAEARYGNGALPVLRFAHGELAGDVAAQWGSGDPAAARAFTRVLVEVRPDLVHLHALTPAVSVRLAAEVKRRRLPLAVTYHTPTMSCRRGTLMRYGRAACDGYLTVRRCSRCMYQHHGVPLPVAYGIGSLPPSVGNAVSHMVPTRKAQLAVRLPALMQLRIAAFHELMALADHVVAKCEWAHELLRRNGVPDSKVTRSPYGLAENRLHAPGAPALPAGGPLRLAFLGRLSPEKGLHVVLEALRGAPQLALQLDVYAVVQPGGDAYVHRVAGMIQADARVSLKAPVPPADVVGLLSRYHALVVPSQWLETGPLVVLEAFAAGIPVLGSNLGGIAERVQHDATGLLVDALSAPAWQAALERIAQDPALAARWRAQVRPPRSIVANAAEYASAYAACLGRSTR